MSTMTPAEIVSELDKHIIGQDKAKKAVAVALRNRWRRQQVAEPLRQEITPKNILMIGPTGVGKTEIARRLAKLADAPFIKIEATKFTEVGYVGRDVDSIVRDLIEISVKQTRETEMRKVRSKATDLAEDRILDVLLPQPRAVGFGASVEHANDDNNATRQTFRKRLREGQLDDKEIELDIEQPTVGMDIMAPPGMEEMTEQIRSMFSNLGSGKKQRRKVKIKEALKLLTDEEAAKMLNDEEVKTKAVQNVEQNGIVFLDEIDKITSRNHEGEAAARVSRQGVQRDLLPLVEGTTINTKCGMEDRSHPVHRERRIPSREAERPDSGAAGALSDPRRARFAVGEGFRSDPRRDRREPRQTVSGAPRDRGRRARIRRRRHSPARRDRLCGQREDREHRRAAPVYGDREAARGSVVRGGQSCRPKRDDRCGLRRPRARRGVEGRGSVALRAVTRGGIAAVAREKTGSPSRGCPSFVFPRIARG